MADYEELKIKVAMVEEANSSIARLKGELQNLNIGPSDALGRAYQRSQTTMMSGMRMVSQGAVNAGGAMRTLHGSLGPVGLGIAALGAGLVKAASAIHGFATDIQTTNALAESLGMGGASFKNVIGQLTNQYSLGAEEATNFTSTIISRVQNLLVADSEVARQLLEVTGSVEKQQNIIKRITGYLNNGEFAQVINEIRRSSDEAYRLEYDKLIASAKFTPAEAESKARLYQKQFDQVFGIDSTTRNKIFGDLAEVTREQEDQHKRLTAMAKEFTDAWGEMREAVDELKVALAELSYPLFTELVAVTGKLIADIAGVLRSLRVLKDWLKNTVAMENWGEIFKNTMGGNFRDAQRLWQGFKNIAHQAWGEIPAVKNFREGTIMANVIVDKFKEFDEWIKGWKLSIPWPEAPWWAEWILGGARKVASAISQPDAAQSRNVAEALSVSPNFLMRERGGSAGVGEVLLVGEKGPEVFVPGTQPYFDFMKRTMSEYEAQAANWGLWGLGVGAAYLLGSELPVDIGLIADVVTFAAQSTKEDLPDPRERPWTGLSTIGRGAVTGLGALEFMMKDAQRGYPVRTAIRAQLGLDDPKEPAEWMPGGARYAEYRAAQERRQRQGWRERQTEDVTSFTRLFGEFALEVGKMAVNPLFSGPAMLARSFGQGFRGVPGFRHRQLGGPVEGPGGGRELREQNQRMGENTDAMEEQALFSRSLVEQLRYLNEYLLDEKLRQGQAGSMGGGFAGGGGLSGGAGASGGWGGGGEGGGGFAGGGAGPVASGGGEGAATGEMAPGVAAGQAGGVRELQGGTRRLPISDQLRGILQRASQETGLRADITSGGQGAIGTTSRRTGSTRHDVGGGRMGAADLKLWDPTLGRYLNPNNANDIPKIGQFVSVSAAGGATGFGASYGNMGQAIHVGGGTKATWGGAKHWLARYAADRSAIDGGGDAVTKISGRSNVKVNVKGSGATQQSGPGGGLFKPTKTMVRSQMQPASDFA